MNGAESTRAFLLGGVFDFVLDLAQREPPIVIGKGYPRDKLIEQFEAWAARHNLKLTKIDVDSFREACKRNLLG